ncbi:MAG: hypothetical protein LUF30_10765 [Lachnospiraceae bacterium]|nr:hypothetical protein [Lachnospiraceae bacterium]
MQTGWQNINGNNYYFRNSNKSVPTGSAATGLLKIGDYRYYFSSTGKMQTGWQTVNGSTYYFKRSTSDTAPRGSAMTGLTKIKGSTYYFSETGRMKTGVRKIDGNVYYFDSDGKMQTGWQTYKNYDYYFKSTGEAATGSYTIGGYVYVFTSGGKLVKRDTETLVKVSGSWYCVNSKGQAKTSGWFTIDSKLCYAASNGKLKTSTTYGGITFNASGYAVSSTATSLKIKTMSIVSQITTDSMTKSQKLYACWKYMTSSSRWYYSGNYPSSYYSGWQISMAYSMLTSGGGNCYGFACAFAALANECGYDSYVVVGRVSGSRDGAADGLTRHCWVKINGCYYDPEAQWAGWYTGCYGLSYYGVTHTITGTYRFGLGVG